MKLRQTAQLSKVAQESRARKKVVITTAYSRSLPSVVMTIFPVAGVLFDNRQS